MPSKTKKKRPNRLIEEKSPYLLQHAYNPVDWFPWSTESFEKARREDKPVFLSIGYSTCHWCHVMERECFEDAEVARLMNEVFVSVKVDREERPDLDGIYMTVCQIMTGTGGWPLTIIMTPRKKPFFAGTYIPKESRFGLMGMLELVPRIKKAWKTRRRELEEIGKKVRFELERTDKRQKNVSTSDMGKEVLDEAYERLVLSFDDRNGGFGLRPKFPPGHSLLFLLRYWKRSKEKFAISMVKKTLQSMRRGGIFDHVGLGFHRYATDAAWNVPHFEKMLYDQATFALVYAEAYQAAGLEQFSRTAHEIFDYVLRDLTSPEGGFYSAEDADSEGEEGKFYLWTEDEIREVLPSNDAVLAIQVFNVRREGNFFQEATKKRDGTNILHLSKPLEQTASELKMTLDELSVLLSRIREKLFTYRAKRVRPSKDDKILCDWNGLMIAALARAAQIFGEKRYLQAAVKAAEFILNKMCTRKGKLFHRLAKGEVAVGGFLDDYAFLVWGLIEIYETGFDVKFLRLALDLTDEMLKKFWDKDFGGFYYTAKDIDKGLVRQKKVHDSGAPSGNSVAMLNLVRLARLTGKATYEEKASRIGRAFSDRVREMPEAHSLMLVALDFAFGPTYTVVLVGEKRGEDTTMMIKALRKQFTPNIVVLFKPEEEMESELADDFRWTLDYGMINDKATAYVCQNQTCLLPTNNVKKMLDQLGIT